MSVSKWKAIIIAGMIVQSTLFVSGVYAQETPTPTAAPTPTPDNSGEIKDLQNKINDLQNKVNELQSQSKTLSTQIAVLDNQVNLTQLRMNAIKQQISDLNNDIGIAEKKVENLETSLDRITKALLHRTVVTYQTGNVEPIQVLLSSNDIDNLFSRLNYMKVVQAHDKELIYETQQAQIDYKNQKNIFEDKKQKVESLQKQLESYTVELDQQKAAKKRLLADTEGSEANYQRLLSQAKAQLAGFSRFTASQGGSSLLGGQTVCDDWGCYYNQRDSQWGGSSLNGTQYTLASDGCLITSMAMIYTHYGHRSVTPQTINSNSNNFASYYPAYLKYTITADGATASRVGATIDSTLASGNPVIVGISYDGGPSPDHFLVLISGSGGNYRMNDPYTPNGHNMPFTDKYSVGSIREIDKVTGL